MKFKFPFNESHFAAVNEARTQSGGEKGAFNKKQEKEQLMQSLSNLKDLADNALYDAVKNEYKSELLKTDDRTDEQIEKAVYGAAELKKQEKAEEATEKNARAVNALNEQKQKDESSRKAATEKSAALYENAKDEAKNQAIKRGLGRSSIIMNLLADYDKAKFKKADEIADIYDQKVAINDKKIEQLGEELEKSLKKLDFETAVNVQSEIDRLKKERDEKNEAVQKYNNSVNEKLANYKKNLENSEYGKQLAAEAEKRKTEYYKQMAKELIAYYEKLTPSEVMADYLSGDYEKLFGKTQKIIEDYVSDRQRKA